MEVEWLILADAAQVVAGKLYLLGGGWDKYVVNTAFPNKHTMAVAVSFRVPWTETNEKHAFELKVTDEDGQLVGKVGGQFEVGRPLGLLQGQDQRVQIAVSINWTIKQPGNFVVVANVDGQEEKRFPFGVIAGPMAGMKQGG